MKPKRCSDAWSALRNDLGLLSEEYDPVSKRLVGNFPQAFSHLALVNSAYNLTRERKPVHQRAHDEHAPPEEMAATALMRARDKRALCSSCGRFRRAVAGFAQRPPKRFSCPGAARSA